MNQELQNIEKPQKNSLTYYKIGEFAKLAHVSISKLRYYDEIGLLKPHIRGKDNSYRIYDSSQLDRISTIKTFQRHGMSLEQMTKILNDKRNFFEQMALFSSNKVEELDRQINSLVKMRNEYENLALSYPVLARELEMKQILYGPLSSYKIIETDYYQKNFFTDGDSSESYFYMKELCDTLGSVQWFVSDTGYEVRLDASEIHLDGKLVFRLSNRHPQIVSENMRTVPASDYLRYLAPMKESDIIDNIKRMLTYCNELCRTPEDYCYVWFMVADYSEDSDEPILQICIPLKPQEPL